MIRSWPVVVVCVGLLSGGLGCGSRALPPQPAAAKPKKVSASPAPQPAAAKPVTVTVDEFSSIEAAWSELERSLALPEGDAQKRAILRCQQWLALQQDRAVPLTAQRATETEQSLAVRLTACRILGLLGPAADEPLLDVARTGEASQLRRKAIETLGRKKPVAPPTVDGLIALLDDGDAQVQWQAIDALQAIGGPAQGAAERLNALRRDHAEEQIRVSAGEALKKVAPRRSFVD
jgi:HEAT repeat protein